MDSEEREFVKKTVSGLAFAATLVLAPMVQADIVNVNGITNASLDGSSGVDLSLAAGTYQLSFVEDAFIAFSRFSSSSGCTAGENCARGWENSVRYIIDPDTFTFGDGNASGGIGPIAGGGYFETAALSFTNSAAYTQTFTLASAATVRFFLYDDNLSDNRGGVSVDVASVPLPAAAWLFGSALFGLVARKKFAKA